MNQTNPVNLGVLACPGGEVFADEVIEHLKGGYRALFDKTIEGLANKYGIENKAAVRRVNFLNDVLSPVHQFHENGGQNNDASQGTCQLPQENAHLRGPERYRSPRFKVSAKFTLFANSEIKAEILDSIRGKDIYIVQDGENHYPVYFSGGDVKKVLSINDHLLTTFVTVDAARQAGAESVTLVMPVYPYSRQHRTKGREGLTAGRIGRILENLGVNRIITLDIHSREISNAFHRMRLENLHASYQIIRALSGIPEIMSDDLVVVSPDTGAVDRNKFYATALKKPLALLYKERDYSRVSTNALINNISDIKLLGDVRNKTLLKIGRAHV
jgi:ribose-phosphate pyrophosphokinase